MRRYYPRLYAAICGEHPHLRLWHFQWLAGRMLYDRLREVLGRLEGDVLDVGCGTKPYRAWMPGAQHYVGIDVADGPLVDALIVPGERWPVEDGSFDVVICTQVLEHVSDLRHTLGGLQRVVWPGGALIVSVPFAYNEHGSPHDYRRLSRHGAAQLFAAHADIERVVVQGSVGSS